MEYISIIIKKSKSYFIKTSILIFVFGILIYLYFGNISRQVFDWDEYNFLKKAYYFDLFVNRDFHDFRWQTGGDEAQPKIGPYIYALALNISGLNNFDKYYKEINFSDYKVDNKLWFEYYLWKIIPPPKSGEFVPIYHVLTVGRITSTLFFMATLVLIFLITYKIKGYTLAIFSVIAIGFTNAFLVLGRIAMTDNMLLAFLYLGLYLSILYAEQLKNGSFVKLIVISVFLGLTTVLSTGVKITGILTLVYISLFFLVLDYVYRKEKVKRNILALSILTTFFVFFALFIFLHPYLYKDTIYNFYYMFDGRTQGALEFQFQDPLLAVTGKVEVLKLLIIRSLIFFDNSPYVYFPLKILNLIFFMYGIFLIIRQSIYNLFGKRRLVNETLFLLWLAVITGSLFFYLMGDYLRYYLPVISGFVIVGTYGFIEFLNRIFQKRKFNLV